LAKTRGGRLTLAEAGLLEDTWLRLHASVLSVRQRFCWSCTSAPARWPMPSRRRPLWLFSGRAGCRPDWLPSGSASREPRSCSRQWPKGRGFWIRVTSITGASRHCDGLFQHNAVAGLLGHRPIQFAPRSARQNPHCAERRRGVHGWWHCRSSRP